ncbi:hypothetical protein DCAR_0418412 [Daucus carota subsp. sativus]|uniref:peptidylprolyl isomerase n=1 Tax=Daucus carota subsp. sativus TaxID=79200 RepID=A0AAF0WZN3_DAUCS|nr:hypothetical protein DCAR_0418412 [Daucus carota subsp. sativus]
MSLYVLYINESSFSLFQCYGIFKMEENDMAKHVDDRPRFRKIVDLAGFYKFESSEAPKQVKAISKGRVSAKLQNFLLDNLPELEAEKKPEFKLGVKDIKLGARIFRKTNIPCICDKYVLELIRGVHKHFDLLTRFPEPCNLDGDRREPTKRIKKSVPLLKYKLFGCTVEDLKKGRTRYRAATLMDTVSVHYTVTRSKDSKLLLDTNTLGDPVQFRVGRGEVIRALDLGICGNDLNFMS